MQDPRVYPAGLFLRGESSTRAGLRKSQPDASGVQFAPASRLSPLGELAFAKQMTERAKKLTNSCQGKFEKPCQSVLALSVAARHLSQRERQVWFAHKTKAFLPEEGGTAQAVTEGAARGQVCARVSLMRQVCSPHRLLGSPLWENWHLRQQMTERAKKLTNSCQGKFEKPCQSVLALSVAARHLSQRERQVWFARKTKAFLPLRKVARRKP